MTDFSRAILGLCQYNYKKERNKERRKEKEKERRKKVGNKMYMISSIVKRNGLHLLLCAVCKDVSG
jgi:hypothetical protein